MDKEKTAIMDFVKNVEGHTSVRLRNILRSSHYNNSGVSFIEDMTEPYFLKFRNAGKKSWDEFKELREIYLSGNFVPKKIELTERRKPGRKPKDPENNPKVVQNIRLRMNVLKTLKAMESYNAFIESAVMEKLERDGIELFPVEELVEN